MESLRIVIVGGGSFNWTPELIRDLIVRPELQESTIILQDVDKSALELTFSLSQKLIAAKNSTCKVERTLDLDVALKGADIVLVTITTGGLETMRADIEIPAKYGIYQSVGDTVGPGGLARALRNIPVMVGIARDMERNCPDAWLLNYTNPMTTLCRAVARETCIKVAGLCHEYYEGLKTLQEMFNVPVEALETKIAGINHLVWLLELKVRGRDAFPELHEFSKKILQQRKDTKSDLTSSALMDSRKVKAKLFQVFEAMPMAGDRHAAEFFPFFLSEDAGKGSSYDIGLTSIAERYRWRADSENTIRALLGEQDISEFLNGDSGEPAPRICAALAVGESYRGMLNLPNKGQIANLPENVVVETFGVLDKKGAYGLPVGELPLPILNIIQKHLLNQEMIVEASLNGDRQLALQAMVNDPLVNNIDSAEPMLVEMLEANCNYLPQFFREESVNQ